MISDIRVITSILYEMVSEGMEVILPVFKVIGKIGPVRNISNKIVVLEK